MKKKILMILLCGVLLVGMTGCGGKDDKKGTSGNIEFNYSKINTNSENIGKNVDVKTVLNEDIKPSSYEGITFTGDTGDLNEADVSVGNLNWVILAEDDNNYMLTTVKETSDTFRLKGPDGYNNGVQAMNAYCAKYYSVEVNGKKYAARALNMNDVEAYYKDKTDTWKQETLGFEGYNKSGIDAKESKYYPSLYTKETGSNMGGNLGVSETQNNYEPYNDSYKSDGSSTTKYLNTYYYANKNQLKDNYTNDKAYNIIFESGSYFVATRYVGFYDSKMSVYEIEKGERNTPNSAKFGIRMITGGNLSGGPLMNSNQNFDFHRYLHPTRPVVVVPKSEINL